MLFFFDEVKAAVSEDPANWSSYSPGLGIPDEVANVATPDASTVVFTMKRAVNPGWFLDDELSTLQLDAGARLGQGRRFRAAA